MEVSTSLLLNKESDAHGADSQELRPPFALDLARLPSIASSAKSQLKTVGALGNGISQYRLSSITEMRGAGLEPARYFYHEPLKLACLPFHHPRTSGEQPKGQPGE
jgi:hypothetical protein